MAQETKVPIKIKRAVSGKSFKLIDFHFYDQRANNLDQDISTGSDESSSGSGQGLTNSQDYVPPPTTGTNPNTPKFIIQMFGLNEKGETCSIFVSNYSPFFYIRVGDDWKKNDVNALLREIKARLGKFHSQSVIGIELVEHHKLYGFSAGNKHQFAKLTFKNVIAMNKTKNLWYTYLNDEERAVEVAQGSREYRRLTPLVFKCLALELYESTIPPLLRYFHIYEISPSGWVFISTTKAKIPPIRTTTCTYEYICTTGQIKARPEKETAVPYKICSFDIEASSSHGDFPLPVKTYKRLASNIADVFRQMSSPPNPPLDAVRAKSLLKRLILTAFELDNFDNIDIVYPKLPIDRTKVLALFEKLCVTPIKNAKLANTEEEDNSHLLDIDRIFEQIKDSAKAAFGKGATAAALAGANTTTASGTDGNDGDDDDDDEDDGVMIADLESARSCQELDVAPVWTAAKSRAANIPASKKLSKTELSATIIDVLLNPKYDRETKLNLTNETLTLIGFPRLKGDEVTFIGSTFLRYGEAEPYLNHCLVVGSCSPVDNAVIQSVDNERELLLKWRELMQSENPDIIIGYNIFGFDYEFMFRRSQEIGCTTEFLQLSRKVGEVCAKAPYNFGQGPSDGPDDGSDDSISKLMLENTKIVLASGEYDLRFPKMMGRLQIDMYTYFRKDFNLASYKLDDVAGQFISDDIKHIVHSDHPRFGPTTELFSSNLTGLRPGDFIHLELSSFTADYYKNGKKFRVLDIIKGRELEEIVKGKMVKNKYNIIVIGGTESIDMSKAKNVKWTMAKDDVSPQDIFRLAKGSADDRAIVAKYCIQDCNLVHHLMSKIDVITGYVEMSRICSVPISYLVLRGQGIKLTSYVAKKCREKDTLMPDLEKSGNSDGYEGAIVLPPKCSMYMDNPVACVDYASLYPSSMISQNYSHDSKVWTKEYDLTGRLVRETGEKSEGIGAVDQSAYKYDNLPGYIYIDIEFDTYRSVRKTPTSRAEKVVSGKKVCRWAQLPDNQKSIMPSILEELLDARKKTRKQIKIEPDPFMQNILDKRQLGYKVTANSLYGQCGARTSTFFEQDVAASTTATGRQMIIYAKRMIEEVYGDRVYETAIHGPVKCKAEYVYGDSVSENTPVYIRSGEQSGEQKQLNICTIDNLANLYGNGKWVPCLEEGKQEKEICEMTEDVETWTERGWTRLYRVIRHALAPHKKMIRILTHTGLVDVTDDHSLISKNGSEISPKEVEVGTELLHHPLPAPLNNCNIYTVEQARVMGFFFGDGSCGGYDCPSGKKKSWALNNASPQIIDKYVNLCKIAYPEFEWRFMDTLESSGVYKISPKCSIYGSISKFVEEYRSKLYFNLAKVIPVEILNGSEEVRQAFWDGLYDADGDKDFRGYVRIDQKNQISASHICWLASSLGWSTSINTRSDKPNIYRITMTKRSQRKNPIAIKRMHEIQYNGYVYDLTTNNHHFAAGIGNMIVHNTDSVFFTFNLENPQTGEKIRGKPALEMTIEIAQDVAGLCTQFLKSPMELTYEKTLMPFILLSKKRYVGMLYETDANKGKLKYMGLSLKRRDSCDYLKDTYGGLLNILMRENNIQAAIDFLNQSLENLVRGVVPMDKLIISKALRSDYKNPMQIGHWVLADRIGKRDPGNKPKPGDRMKFVFIIPQTSSGGGGGGGGGKGSKAAAKKVLMGDKIETPEYVLEHKIQIDYTHYITNQLMKPLQQLLGLALVPIWEHQRKTSTIMTFKKDVAKLEAEYPDIEEFMKKREKYCSAKVKALLFDKILNKIENSRSGAQEITGFFGKSN